MYLKSEYVYEKIKQQQININLHLRIIVKLWLITMILHLLRMDKCFSKLLTTTKMLNMKRKIFFYQIYVMHTINDDKIVWEQFKDQPIL